MTTLNTTQPLTVTAVLSNDEIAALAHPTGVEIIPAPGEGKVLWPIAILMVVSKTAVYTNVDPTADIWLEYTGGGIVSAGPGTTDGHLVFDDGTDPIIVEQTINIAASGVLTDYENLPIQVIASNGALSDLADGDITNTLSVSVVYHVIELPS